MKLIKVPNVHMALPVALDILDKHGVDRDSRNGPVKMAPWPVITEYLIPQQRVLFWPQRNANPFFHLYESLWMLVGRQDVEPLLRYVKNVINYSDNGLTFHGAYGYRWRKHFLSYPDLEAGRDQLKIIVHKLQQNPNDRRGVLQMWDPTIDLGTQGKDIPCNTCATFQINHDGKLELTVFCRSNDIIWGCYGANAVHFSMLQEYMALWIGCPVGPYRQISVNWHAYKDTLELVKHIPRPPDIKNWYHSTIARCPINPYNLDVHYIPMTEAGSISAIKAGIRSLLQDVDRNFKHQGSNLEYAYDPWSKMVYTVLYAHHLWRNLPAPERYLRSLEVLSSADPTIDWIKAATEWVQRRYDAWKEKQ